MKIILSDSFVPLLDDKHRYLVLCGGRGSGKSEFAGRKIFWRCMFEGNHRFLILRKVRSRVRESVLEVMLRILRENAVAFEFNKSERTITFFNPAGKRNEILFDGLDDPEKIKSIKGLTGIWMEETTNFTEKDFMDIDLCLREPGPSYKQIILSFNPLEAEAPWLKKMFFDYPNKDACVHRSTIEDNPIEEVRREYRARLDELLSQNEAYYKIYRLGQWAIIKGRIFAWDVVSLPDIKFDETFYGGDFGYSIDPAAVIRIYRKAEEFWLQELIYETGLTNQSLGMKMRDCGIKSEPNYFDSAEPKSIQELYEMGLNVLPSEKGPDSVRVSIDFLKSKKIHIIEGSNHIIDECSSYTWREDKQGNFLPEPVKFKDHAMSAVRYGIYTHCSRLMPNIRLFNLRG